MGSGTGRPRGKRETRWQQPWCLVEEWLDAAVCGPVHSGLSSSSKCLYTPVVAALSAPAPSHQPAAGHAAPEVCYWPLRGARGGSWVCRACKGLNIIKIHMRKKSYALFAASRRGVNGRGVMAVLWS